QDRAARAIICLVVQWTEHPGPNREAGSSILPETTNWRSSRRGRRARLENVACPRAWGSTPHSSASLKQDDQSGNQAPDQSHTLETHVQIVVLQPTHWVRFWERPAL